MKQLTALAILLLLISGVVSAQDQTTFTLNCYEVDSEQNITIHLGYSTTVVEHYIGSGLDFTTEVGTYPDAFTVKLNSYDPYPALGLALVSDRSLPDIVEPVVVSIPLSISGLPVCGQEATPAPLPPSTPVPTPCAHQARNEATGKMYCYQPLPGGVIPLPDAS
jgi:hypothetical protein